MTIMDMCVYCERADRERGIAKGMGIGELVKRNPNKRFKDCIIDNRSLANSFYLTACKSIALLLLLLLIVMRLST